MQWLRLTALMMLLAGCSDPDPYRPAELHLVSQAEMIQRALRFEYPEFSQITFRNETGELLAYDSLLRIPDPSVFALDYYKNDAAEIVEAVVREGTEADRVFQQRYADAANNGPELKQISVDCTDKVAFLQRIFERDQASRRTGIIDRKNDHENLELITSFLDKCGVPEFGEVNDEQRAAIWAVLQHGPTDIRLAHLPQLETAAERGDISPAVIATMRDRILVDQGEPQVYGTQVGVDPVTGQHFLHPLQDAASVDRRRARIGMGPLRDYLSRWKIEFTTPQR